MLAPMPTSSQSAHPTPETDPQPPCLLSSTEAAQGNQSRRWKQERSCLPGSSVKSVQELYSRPFGGEQEENPAKVPEKEGNFGATATKEERLLWRSRNKAVFHAGVRSPARRCKDNLELRPVTEQSCQETKVLCAPWLQISGEFRHHGAADRHRIDASWRLRLVHPLQDPPGPLVGQEKVYRGTAIIRQS